ncbi:hypothetical protein BH11MYX1_BH11MYX1_53880 [soil metagenome]
MFIFAWRSLALISLVAACTKEPPPPPPHGELPAPAIVQKTAPGVAPAPTAPMAEAGTGPITENDVSGTVVETMSSGGYTYAKLERGGSQAWVAGPETALAVGNKVGQTRGSLMTSFHSDTLKRTFDQIYFVSSLPVAGGTAAPAKVATPAAPIGKLETAKGGTTIAAIFAAKTTLTGKPVVVRGKVVKVNNGILGKNWLHIQDGTGAAGTNDLTVTTAATVAKDDVVVVRGNVATDKDFGAGYAYAVMIEDATVAPN